MNHRQLLVGIAMVLGLVFYAAAQTKDKKSGPKFELTEDERTILDLTNAAREKEKLPPLKPNRILTEVARVHSANMAKKGEMNHVLDGKRPDQRVAAAGYDFRAVGENIAAGEGWSLEDVFKGWMESPEHKANILRKEYREIGIGIARDGKDQVYYTQVFGTARIKRSKSSGGVAYSDIKQTIFFRLSCARQAEAVSAARFQTHRENSG
jgi:uncharacterized protein YkwD